MKAQYLVSIIVHVEVCDQKLKGDLAKLNSFLIKNYNSFEIIITGNGLNTSEFNSLKEIISKLYNIRALGFTSKVSYETAIMAGIESSIGDYALIWNIGTKPLQLINEFVNKNIKVDGFVVGEDDSNMRLEFESYSYLYSTVVFFSLPKRDF